MNWEDMCFSNRAKVVRKFLAEFHEMPKTEQVQHAINLSNWALEMYENGLDFLAEIQQLRREVAGLREVA